jgi:hypothetical protein
MYPRNSADASNYEPDLTQEVEVEEESDEGRYTLYFLFKGNPWAKAIDKRGHKDKPIELEGAVDLEKRKDQNKELWKKAVDVAGHSDSPIELGSAVNINAHKDNRIELGGGIKLERRAAVDIDRKSRKGTTSFDGAIDIGSHKDQQIESAITAKEKPEEMSDKRQYSQPWNPFQQEKDIYEELKKELFELPLVDESRCRSLEGQFNEALNRASDWRSLSLADAILKEANRCPFWLGGMGRLEQKAKQIQRHLAEKDRRLKEEIARQQRINQRLQWCENIFIDAIRNFRAGNPTSAELLLMKAAQAQCLMNQHQYYEIRNWKIHYFRQRNRLQQKAGDGDTLLGQDPSPFFRGPFYRR